MASRARLAKPNHQRGCGNSWSGTSFGSVVASVTFGSQIFTTVDDSGSGNGMDDDLPLHLQIPINQLKQPIFRLLSKKGIFPAGSKFPAIMQQCYGNGLKALKQIILCLILYSKTNLQL